MMATDATYAPSADTSSTAETAMQAEQPADLRLGSLMEGEDADFMVAEAAGVAQAATPADSAATTAAAMGATMEGPTAVLDLMGGEQTRGSHNWRHQEDDDATASGCHERLVHVITLPTLADSHQQRPLQPASMIASAAGGSQHPVWPKRHDDGHSRPADQMARYGCHGDTTGPVVLSGPNFASMMHRGEDDETLADDMEGEILQAAVHVKRCSEEGRGGGAVKPAAAAAAAAATTAAAASPAVSGAAAAAAVKGTTTSVNCRRRLDAWQRSALEQQFREGRQLSSERRAALAAELGVQPRQVQFWFRTRRQRWKARRQEQRLERMRQACDLWESRMDMLRGDYELLKGDYNTLLAHNAGLKSKVADALEAVPHRGPHHRSISLPSSAHDPLLGGRGTSFADPGVASSAERRGASGRESQQREMNAHGVQNLERTLASEHENALQLRNECLFYSAAVASVGIDVGLSLDRMLCEERVTI